MSHNLDHTPSSNEYLLGIGANLPSSVGAPMDTCLWAEGALSNISTSKIRVSHYYKTSAFPVDLGPDYVNAAVAITSELTPKALLRALLEIEASVGRTRLARWESRTLDIDMLGFGSEICPDVATVAQWVGLDPVDQATLAPQELVLPHPRLHERRFVLVPLNDIAPDWTHPVFGRTVHALLDALPDNPQAKVRQIPSHEIHEARNKFTIP